MRRRPLTSPQGIPKHRCEIEGGEVCRECLPAWRLYCAGEMERGRDGRRKEAREKKIGGGRGMEQKIETRMKKKKIKVEMNEIKVGERRVM